MITNYTTYIKENSNNTEITIKKSSFEHGNNNYIVYLNNKKCGKYSLNCFNNDNFIWLTNFKIYEKFRGQHLSKKILTYIVNTLKQGISFWNEEPKKFDYIILCTNKDNTIAINLYKSFGFKEFKEDWMLDYFIYFKYDLL
jgi:hypothetical protein